MENPFKLNLTSNIVYTTGEGNTPALPIKQKCYNLEPNLLEAQYNYASGREIDQQNLTKNVKSLLQIQNNQTEILVYLAKVLFNEISEPLRELKGEMIKITQRIDTLEASNKELVEITNQLKEANKKIEELSQKL